MKEIDLQRFSSVLNGVMDIYARKLDKTTLNIFWSLLRNYKISLVEEAFMSHVSDMDSGKYAPTPSDILKKITGGYEILSRNAVRIVRGAIDIYSSFSDIRFHDMSIDKTIEVMGGWKSICESRSEKILEDFRKNYIEVIKKNPELIWKENEITDYWNSQKRMVIVFGDLRKKRRIGAIEEKINEYEEKNKYLNGLLEKEMHSMSIDIDNLSDYKLRLNNYSAQLSHVEITIDYLKSLKEKIESEIALFDENCDLTLQACNKNQFKDSLEHQG